MHQFTLEEKFRIHYTRRHNELGCLTFFSRIERVLQGEIPFWEIYQPLALADLEEEMVNMVGKKFKELVQECLGSEDGPRLEEILMSSWCKFHNTPHLELTCPLCANIITQVKGSLKKLEHPTLNEGDSSHEVGELSTFGG